MRVTNQGTRRASASQALGVIAVLGLCGSTAVLACSGATGADIGQQANCGHGTVVSGNQCVGADAAASPEGSSEAGLADSQGLPETGVADALDAPDVVTWTADPCPAEPLAVDCSSSCGSAQYDCNQNTVSCNPFRTSMSDPQIIKLTIPITLRTPDKPGKDPKCVQSCSHMTNVLQPVYALAFDVETNSAMDLFEVRVGPPWWIEQVYTFNAPIFCPPVTPDVPRGQGCEGYKGGGRTILVWTDDPNAPARDVTIRQVQGVQLVCH
jgi:hypothetical protein